MEINQALQFVKKIKKTTDIKEVAQLLSTGEWIAICATPSDKDTYTFSLGFTGSMQTLEAQYLQGEAF